MTRGGERGWRAASERQGSGLRAPGMWLASGRRATGEQLGSDWGVTRERPGGPPKPFLRSKTSGGNEVLTIFVCILEIVSYSNVNKEKNNK